MSRTWYSNDGISPSASPHPKTSSEPILQARSFANWDAQVPVRSSSRLQGLTSYSAVFGESDDRLNRALRIDAPAALRSAPTTPDPRQVQRGARLLVLLFEHLPLYERLAETSLELSPEGSLLGYRLVSILIRSLKDTYEAWTTDAKDPNAQFANMLGWSQKIFDNGSRTIDVHPPMAPEDFIRAVSGTWEGIGLVLSVIGQGAMLERDWKSIYEMDGTVSRDQRSIAVMAAAASDACLQFCDNFGTVHDPLGWLLFQHIHLLILVYGDNDYRPWRKLAELSNVVFTLDQSKQSAQLPFFLIELRKRLMAGAYGIDKRLATFLARPPQISWRYCDMQLPLDLSYDEILAAPETREAAISKLDLSGWNTKGVIHKAAWLRISLLVGSIREQVLELSLSRQVEDLPLKVSEISQNSRRTWDELPGFLHWRPGVESSILHSSVLIPMNLEFLYNDFLLYRILVKRAQTGYESLIGISHEILKTTLELIGKEIGSGTGTYSVGWNASSFGIPAAGVLAMELLRQSGYLSQSSPPNISHRRSEIIQNLSIFASHLQYVVRPHDGNYDICQYSRRIICRILDRILSVNLPALSSPLPAEVLATDWLNGESILLDDGTDFLTWVDGLNSNAQ
ncbi:hypothetical protein MPDQ_005015 [Monascus purpureus]|uniref:Transcription factor domain-containing protein n=1 Tax=Monascus purpureus TaxID=5098 RepID=A0A507QX65_MONPU|nr:hypothetical protein MPDQ_005015 [Monascus purpureus]